MKTKRCVDGDQISIELGSPARCDSMIGPEDERAVLKDRRLLLKLVGFDLMEQQHHLQYGRYDASLQ